MNRHLLEKVKKNQMSMLPPFQMICGQIKIGDFFMLLSERKNKFSDLISPPTMSFPTIAKYKSIQPT